MLNLIKQVISKKSKTTLPNPNFEYRIVFRKGAVEAIKKVKGWRTDAEMAKALGITRSYINQLKKTRVSATSTVITRLAAQLGNTLCNWWVHFEIVPYGIIDQNHPTWNQEKYMGQQPYARFSPCAEIRKLDYKTEEKKI